MCHSLLPLQSGRHVLEVEFISLLELIKEDRTTDGGYTVGGGDREDVMRVVRLGVRLIDACT